MSHKNDGVARVNRIRGKKTRFPVEKVRRIAGKMGCEGRHVLQKAGCDKKITTVYGYIANDQIPYDLNERLEELYQEWVVSGKDMVHG